jgi:hypothetical protein
MPVTQVQCPSCGVTLKPSRPVEPGQRLKCPRCATAFQVAAPPPAAPEEALEEVGTEPAPAAAAPAEKKSRTGLILLLAGLGVGGLCLCCGGLGVVGFVVHRAAGPAGTGLAGIQVPGVTDSRESVPRDQARLMTDIANLLATVQDQASADRALARLKKDIGPRIQDLVKRNKAGGQVDFAWQQEMAKKYGPETQAAAFKIQDEVRRLKNVPGGPAVIQELKDESRDWMTIQFVLP